MTFESVSLGTSTPCQNVSPPKDHAVDDPDLKQTISTISEAAASRPALGVYTGQSCVRQSHLGGQDSRALRQHRLCDG